MHTRKSFLFLQLAHHQWGARPISLAPPISELSGSQSLKSAWSGSANERASWGPGNQSGVRRAVARLVADVCNGHILLDIPFFCQPRLSSFFTSYHILPSECYSYADISERNDPGIVELFPRIISSSINSTCSWHFMEILFYYFSKITFHFPHNSTRQAGTGKILT